MSQPSTTGAKVMLAANVVMAGLFVFSAYVQHNDPDPAQWMAIYLAAALACLWPPRLGASWIVAALVGVAALIWGITLAYAAAGRTTPGDMFGSWKMKDPAAEEGREAIGLFLVAAWMTVKTGWSLAVSRRSRERAPSGAA